VDIRVVTTKHVQHFVDKAAVKTPLYTDTEEWEVRVSVDQ
jgi:hypothetical protein